MLATSIGKDAWNFKHLTKNNGRPADGILIHTFITKETILKIVGCKIR